MVSVPLFAIILYFGAVISCIILLFMALREYRLIRKKRKEKKNE